MISTYSQASQDVFAYYINNKISDGFFLDLGCNEPFKYNNTALLEKNGWKGILIDYNPDLVRLCQENRTNTCITADLKNSSLTDILKQHNSPIVIDYISMDLDYDIALNSIKTLDFNLYKCKCLTFEHDYYSTKSDMMVKSREYLESVGLVIVCKNVQIFEDSSFEDWYIDPSFVPKEIYEPLICNNIHHSNIFNKIQKLL